MKALVLAHRSIGAACVGVNGDPDLGLTVGSNAADFSYFTAPAGHTFIWRLFAERKEAISFLKKRMPGEKRAQEWAESIPLSSAKELKSYH